MTESTSLADQETVIDDDEVVRLKLALANMAYDIEVLRHNISQDEPKEKVQLLRNQKNRIGLRSRKMMNNIRQASKRNLVGRGMSLRSLRVDYSKEGLLEDFPEARNFPTLDETKPWRNRPCHLNHEEISNSEKSEDLECELERKIARIKLEIAQTYSEIDDNSLDTRKFSVKHKQIVDESASIQELDVRAQQKLEHLIVENQILRETHRGLSEEIQHYTDVRQLFNKETYNMLVELDELGTGSRE